MRSSAVKKQSSLTPSDYILAPLSEQEQFDAAFAVCRQAFGRSRLKRKDVESAIEKIRRKIFVRKHSKSRH